MNFNYPYCMINIKQFQKPKENDFFFAHHFQRKISGVFALLLKRTFITPNHITLASIIVGLYSFYYFLKGDAYHDLIGILLFQLSFLLDCIDGDLARLRSENRVKLSGMYFDYLRSLLLEPVLPIVLTIGLVINGYSELILIGMIIATIWRWAPQFAREHIVIRQLERNKDLVNNSQFFVDMPKGFSNKNTSFARLISKIVIIFWGLPIGLMNTITILAVTGVYLLNQEQYNEVKFIYLLLLATFYFLHFMKSTVDEYKLLDEFWK